MPDSPSSLLAFALTGENLPLTGDIGAADRFLARLDSAGWPARRIRDQAHSRWDEDAAWPYPLAPGRLHGIGAAQWYAALTRVRRQLGLDVVRQPPSQRTELTAEERRLLADVPPHHGPVG